LAVPLEKKSGFVKPFQSRRFKKQRYLKVWFNAPDLTPAQITQRLKRMGSGLVQ
jgi:hypothetical protein